MRSAALRRAWALAATLAFAVTASAQVCHVGASPANLDGYDFASDAKETKKVARVMIRMTQEVNVEVNPGIATSHSLLGRLCLKKGDKASARAQFERAAALDPGEEFYRKQLEELKQP